jgi:hypothetical protein
MKKHYPTLIAIAFLFGFTLAQTHSAKAQCTIDFSVTQPGLYPDTLPDGYVGQLYSEDVTFYLPLDTQGFPFTNFEIQAISGLPFGVSWVCNNSGNGCNYDPAVSQYGCVNFSGTPLLPGTYSLDVLIIASLGALGDYPTYYNTPLIIHPDTASNNGFTMTNSYGCLPLTVDFTNNNPGLMAYAWDFGNSNQSTAENPSPQIYNTAGAFEVTYEAWADTVTQYILTNVDVLSIPNNWGWPGDLDPDIYINIFDPSSTLIYTSATIQDQNPPVSFAIPNIQLSAGTYTIEVWDEDGAVFGADDDLGSTSFQGHSSGGVVTNGSTSTNQTITQFVPPPTIVSVDTVFVFDVPNTPNIDSLGLSLWTDSVNLSLQWYGNGNPLIGENSPNYTATQSGDYWVIATTPAGCFASSDTITITFCDPAIQPNITNQGNILWTDSLGLDVQWYFNGTPLVGETNSVHIAQNTGDYWVVVTLFNGCTANSDTISVTVVGVNDFISSDKLLQIYPNPNNGQFTLNFLFQTNESVHLQIFDAMGKLVFEQQNIAEKSQKTIDLQGLAKGMYHIRAASAKATVHKKMIIR